MKSGPRSCHLCWMETASQIPDALIIPLVPVPNPAGPSINSSQLSMDVRFELLLVDFACAQKCGQFQCYVLQLLLRETSQDIYISDPFPMVMYGYLKTL